MVDSADLVPAFSSFSVDGSSAAPKTQTSAPTAAPAAAAAAVPATAPAAVSSPPPSSNQRVIASPLAKKVASELNIDLRSIVGTGPNHLIIKADVLEYKPAQAVVTAAPAIAATSTAAAPAAVPASETAVGNFKDIPNSNMRKVIARRLTESKQTIPHYYLSQVF